MNAMFRIQTLNGRCFVRGMTVNELFLYVSNEKKDKTMSTEVPRFTIVSSYAIFGLRNVFWNQLIP